MKFYKPRYSREGSYDDSNKGGIHKKIPLNMRVEPEIVALTKKIAALKHLDGYTQLLRMYIWEGVEKDRSLLRKVGLA